MKKLTHFFPIGILLLVALIISSGCKKKAEDPVPIVPSFTMTYITVNLVGGGFGLQFSAKCANDDVKMTKVVITDPMSSFSETYNLNGTIFVKNQIFDLQATDQAYIKSAGVWRFNYVGNRTADGVTFAVDATLTVSK